MRTVILASAVLAITTTACAVNKTLVPTGGSRADGIVRMSYTVAAFEVPKVDYNGAAQKAAERCAVWGYKGAEAFGGATQVCLSQDMYGNCSNTQFTVEYQCTGDGANR